VARSEGRPRYEDEASGKAEEGILRVLLLDPALARSPSLPPAEDFTAPELRHIYTEILQRLRRGGEVSPATLSAALSGEEMSLLIRLQGEPLAYITGRWEFYGLPKVVSSDVLIPRADTEVLVDAVKDLLIGYKMDARILDLCCGSGCITCAVGHELPATRLVSVDISATALEVCRQNISMNRLSSRAITVQADATASPPMSIGRFDMIISNPPYIPSAEILTLDSSVRDYEPIWALDGGKNGLKFYKSIIKYWKSLLPEGGFLLFEVGEGQAEPVREMLLSAGFRSADTRVDTGGVQRVVFGVM
jgi:release factor glutamine methyltransferase